MEAKRQGVECIDDWNAFLEKSKSSVLAKWTKDAHVNLTRKDFKFIRTIGEGEFGKVELAKWKKNYYAIKVHDKSLTMIPDLNEKLLNEKHALQASKFPFIIHMEFSFSDDENLYFVMPFVQGGDLWLHLRRNYRFPEYSAKFYSSQVLLALEYLHFLGLIYRDIKPENILMDRDGYLKLCDLGFCKRISARTYSMCGTTEFVAPEVILNRGYSFPADWWSFGVLLFEMCAGNTPFFCKNEFCVFENITQGRFIMPKGFSYDLQDLIRNLLQTDPTNRYGNLKNGVNDIKDHLWYSDINWLDILNKRVTPPFIPHLRGRGDTTYYNNLDLKHNIRLNDAWDIIALP